VSKSILLPVITRSLVSAAPRAFVQAVELFGFTLVRVMLPASFSQVAPPSVEASTKPKSHSSSMSNHVLKFSAPPAGVFSWHAVRQQVPETAGHLHRPFDRRHAGLPLAADEDVHRRLKPVVAPEEPGVRLQCPHRELHRPDWKPPV
jgi:zinc transporter ZupT